MEPLTIHVIYRHEDGSWWVESPDVPGFYATGDTYLETQKLVIEGLEFHLGHNNFTILEETLSS